MGKIEADVDRKRRNNKLFFFFSYCLCHTHQYLTLLLKEREDDRCVTAPPEVLGMVLAWMFRA